jgi:predicted nucleotidyltransferase
MKAREKNIELENYRVEILNLLAQEAEFIRGRIEDEISIPVVSLWIHGSILDPATFSEESDIDIVATVNVNEPDGLLNDVSEKLGGKVWLGDAGALDVIVLNKTEPKGKQIL